MKTINNIVSSVFTLILLSTFSCKDKASKDTLDENSEVLEVKVKGKTVSYATD